MNNAYIRAQQCKVKEAKFPFVKIGGQYWTTKNLSLAVTPQGNTIPEVQANGNVEKITNIANREFSSDTGFWGKSTRVAITSGVMRFDNAASYSNFSRPTLLIAFKSYKITLTVLNYSTGQINLYNGIDNVLIPSVNGTYTAYIKGYTTLYIGTLTSSATYDIDNVSIQEIGWSGSQELYDGIYAQTSGTVEQKTYAAVKAAAMWCNYNNDAPTGLIYGKLYNWFAVKLLQMDIDYYNAANPTKKWANGFRMPTRAEFQTLSTYLGGDAVSGGHLKEAGLAHWNSPNTGADNSSGFTALGSGNRDDLGGFGNTLNQSFFRSIDGYRMYFLYNSSSTTIATIENTRGYSIRLIKS